MLNVPIYGTHGALALQHLEKEETALTRTPAPLNCCEASPRSMVQYVRKNNPGSNKNSPEFRHSLSLGMPHTPEASLCNLVIIAPSRFAFRVRYDHHAQHAVLQKQLEDFSTGVFHTLDLLPH